MREFGEFLAGFCVAAGLAVLAYLAHYTAPKENGCWTDSQIFRAYQRGCTISTDPHTLKRSIVRCPGDPENTVTQ